MKKFLLFLFGIRKKEEKREYRPKVTVLIPAFNEEKTIAQTILSIKAQTYPVEEIIVVDDGSTDKTGEIAKSLGARVVRTPKNTGTKAKAQNFGLQFVQTEVVITVDADTVLKEDAIEKILPALSDGETFSACGFVLPQKRRTFWERARYIQYLYFIGLPKNTQDFWGVPLVSSGCFSAYNTKMLKEVGGFPEGTIVEDMVLTWQAHLEKKKTKLVPQAVCYPKDPENWHQYKAQMLRWNRGFLQAISVFGLKLLKNPRLAFFSWWYLISGILNLFLWVFFFGYLVWILWQKRYFVYPFYLLFFGMILEAIIVLIVVILNAKRTRTLKEALLDFPLYWFISPIDSYLFFLSLWKEWIRGQKLVVWEKGH
jgi:biofilm PGA synthesis N-glycosyltransferase PgaC